MNITGIGTFFNRGSGIGALEAALREGWQPPGEVRSARKPEEKRAAYQVNFDSVRDKALLKKIRRADKLSKMAVVAASEAITDGGRSNVAGHRTGIILATAFGAHVTTFGFLDDILNYGDAAVSPTTFSNSVHNAAASYIASSLNIKGPALTLTQFAFPFPTALQLARTWLDQQRCDRVLVGSVDQYGDVLGYAAGRKLIPAADGRIRPFSLERTGCVPGEGATFLVATNANEEEAYCSVPDIATFGKGPAADPADLYIIDNDGMLPDASPYRHLVSSGVPVSCYTPLWGSMLIGAAFSTAAAALMLKKQMRYASPVPEHGDICQPVASSEPHPLRTIRCVSYDCCGNRSVITLTRQ